jgi:hypothetical protein
MNKCTQCQKDTTNPRFCSRSCSAKYYNHLRSKSNKRICVVCQLPLGKNARLFCSHKCCKLYQWQICKEKIEQNGYFYPAYRFDTSTPHVKRYLKEKYGDKCSICGLTSWQNKSIVLISDHINGIANDWSISNLRLVCPNCDSQLPTFKRKNKNGGRQYRNKSHLGESNPHKDTLQKC